MGIDLKAAKDHKNYCRVRNVERAVTQRVSAGEETVLEYTADGLPIAPYFPLTASPKNLSQLGTGFPLYFELIRSLAVCIMLFAVLFVPLVFTSYWGIDENDQNKWGAISNWLKWFYTAGNMPADSTSPLVAILILVSAVIFVVAMTHLNRRQEHMERVCDANGVHPNDFALMVRGLPFDAIDEKEIADFITRPFRLQKNHRASVGEEEDLNEPPYPDDPLDPDVPQVAKVVIGYDIHEIHEIFKKVKTYGEQLQKLEDTIDGNDGCCGGSCGTCWCRCCRKPDDEVTEADASRTDEARLSRYGHIPGYSTTFHRFVNARKITDGYKNFTSPDLKSSGFAIVVFTRQDTLRKALEYWSDSFRVRSSRYTCNLIKSGLPLFRGIDPVSVRRAANPSDTIWQNMGVRWTTRLKWQIVVSFIILAMTVFSGFLAWQLIEYGMNQRVDPDLHWVWALCLSLLPALVVEIINFLMYPIIKTSVKFEKHPTIVERDTSCMMKLAVFLILNTSMVYVIIHREPEDWYIAGGLFENILIQLIYAALYDPIYLCIDWSVRMKQVILKCCINAETTKMSQEKYNKNLEGNSFSTASRTAVYIKIFTLTAIFVPVMPLVGLVTLSAFFFQYYTDKYLLLRRCRRPPNQDSQMSRSALAFARVLMCLGPGMSMYLLPPAYSNTMGNIIQGCGIAGVVFTFLGATVPDVIQQRLFFAWKVFPNSDFDFSNAPNWFEAQHFFVAVYHRSHPVYKAMPESINPTMISPNSCGADFDSTSLEGIAKINFSTQIQAAVTKASIERVAGANLEVVQKAKLGGVRGGGLTERTARSNTVKSTTGDVADVDGGL